MPPYFLRASVGSTQAPSPPPSCFIDVHPQPSNASIGEANTSSILKELPLEVLIPTFLLLVMSSVMVTAVNAVFNIFAHQDRMVMETFQQWSRVLWMSKAAHIVEAPSAEQAHRMTQTHHVAAVTARSTTPVMSPVELYNSAAFFRGIAAPTGPAASSTGAMASSAPDVILVGLASSCSATPLPSASSAAPYTGDADVIAEAEVYHEENPPAAVPAPVVAEALTNTMEAVRRESQRVIFEFHPYYIILCAAKEFTMLIYIQYHFGGIHGGWRRFCVCGAANIFSGLLTSVWEYAMMALLPLDLDRATPVVVKEEKKADSVFIVELLLRISTLELNDLPTVLMQGTTFVVFAAVLVPLLGTFCSSGLVRYMWIYVPLWLVYLVVRHIYYQGAGSFPSPRARNAAAVVGMTNEMLKAFLMKALTVFVLLFTMQSSFLLGLAWAEGATYDEGLQYMALHEFGFHAGAFASSFQKVRGDHGTCRVALCSSCRGVALTPQRMQLQHRDRIIGSHGAGLVNHQSMATMEIRSNFTRVQNAAPAADLFRTKVHEGLGTSDKDPYLRTLPNQESRPPESSVLRVAAATAPSLEERQRLHQKWGTLQYWLGDQYPRLPLFLEELLVSDALPVSPAAETMVQTFAAEVIPAVAKQGGPGAEEKLEALWKQAVQAYGKLNTSHVFDKVAFERELAVLHARYQADMSALSPCEDGALALEVLRRKAIAKRNTFLREGLLPMVRNSPYVGYGDGVWRVFFDSVAAHKRDLFSSSNSLVSATLGFAWEGLMMEDTVRTPAMTAPVALYLLLVSISASHNRAPAELKTASAHLDEGIVSTEQRVVPSAFATVSPIVKRRFVADALKGLLGDLKGCGRLAKALRSARLYDWSRDAALCEAMLDDQQLLRADVENMVDRFDSTAEVKSLLQSLMSGTDSAITAHVSHVFQLPGMASKNHQLVDWDTAMSAVDWPRCWREHARELLSDPATLEAVYRLLKNATGAKHATKRLFCDEYAAEVEAALQRCKERARARKARAEQLVRNLTSYEQVEGTLAVLRKAGVSLRELECAELATAEQRTVRRPQVDSGVLDLLLEAIRQRHPSWAKSGVLPAVASAAAKSPVWYLECMTRIYIRLSYVPQAGAALMAQHTRRRLGPVGTEPTQFNVPTEMGMVEQYDNLQYKRYDWQGWYQRMVDVHNRNVSIKCRLDDLKRLDAYGNPFVEMQTERRLRILADHRVGMGVLKLDSDKYEDQHDNITYGSTKLSELLADARKAQLGKEYWPSVEVKVRRPSGQSKTYYSVLDDARIESKSKELYAKYREAKKRSLFVTPMDLWLDVKGMQVRKAAETADAQGYTVDSLHYTMDDDSSDKG